MRDAVIALSIALSVAACTPRTLAITPAHPAHPDAESGRLAGPPPALRPGVTESADQRPAEQPSAPSTEHEGHGKPEQESLTPKTPPSTGHEGHDMGAPARQPGDATSGGASGAAPEQKPTEQAPTKPPAKKPTKKPAKKPATKPATQPTTAPADKPATPPSGHEGRH